MISDILLSPPAAFIFFLLIAYGINEIGRQIAAPGEHHDDKHLAYTGGETVPPPTGGRLSYHAFFRLALLFGILHVATLVLSTLPLGVRPRKTALAYTIAIAISVFILVEEPKSEKEIPEAEKIPLSFP